MEITKEMFQIWKADPVTKYVFKTLNEDLEVQMDLLEPNLEEPDKIATRYAFKEGFKRGIKRLLEVDYE